MKIPLHLMRKYSLIYLMATNKKPTRAFLCEGSGSSSTAFSRSMGALAEDYGMRVHFIADGTGITKQSGFYQITDWGVFDKAKFLEYYAALGSSEAAK